MKKLPSKIHKEITRLCEEGDKLLKADQRTEAWKCYLQALDMLPEPMTQWEAATWILATLGDLIFLGGHYEKAMDAFEDAVRCPGGLGNPFIHLRLGQIAYELKDMERAADELTRAYMGAGREIFEKENPKYFKLLEKVLRPPKGQDRL